MSIVTFDKNDTALFLEEGDFWLAADNPVDDIDTRLEELIHIANGTVPENLFGTMPDESQPNIGTSPRRPRRPA